MDQKKLEQVRKDTEEVQKMLMGKKTTTRFDWEHGYQKARRLSRSFDTLEEARTFAEGKTNTDIYISKGRYKVEWTKITDIPT